MRLDDAPMDELDRAIAREAAVLRAHLARSADTDLEWRQFRPALAEVRVLSGRPSPSPSSRRWLGAIAAGVAAAMIATLVVVQTVRDDAPIDRPDVTTPPTSTTVLPTTTVPPADPDRTGLLRTGPYELVTTSVVDEVGREGVDVFVESPDGSARLVRHIGNSELEEGWTLTAYGSVSSTGWLALTARSGEESGWVFVDLLSADRPLRLVKGITDGGRWGPTDLFALSLNGGREAVIDPVTGEVREIRNADYPGGSPDIIWTADGAGFLASAGGSFGGISEVDGSTDIQPRTWRVTPLDGSADQPGVPELDPFGTTRYVAEGGSWLTVGACSSVLDLCLPGGRLMDGTLVRQVVVADAEGNSTTWYDDDLPGARLMQSSFSYDGGSLWLLLERSGASGAELVLARVTAPRGLEIMTTLPIPEPPQDVAVPGGFETRFSATMWLSPDDELAFIGTLRVEAEGPTGESVLLRTDGTQAPVPIARGVAGYLPTSVVDLLVS